MTSAKSPPTIFAVAAQREIHTAGAKADSCFIAPADSTSGAFLSGHQNTGSSVERGRAGGQGKYAPGLVRVSAGLRVLDSRCAED